MYGSEVPPKIILSINTSWNIVNFRRGLVRALRDRGFEVLALSPDDPYAGRLAELGCHHLPLAMDNKGTNPVRDAGLFLRYLAALRREQPAVFLGWTIKPNVYGSLAAHLLGVPVINNVSGLGTAFLSSGWLNRVVRVLYACAFARSRRVFFQNRDDEALFIESGLLRPDQAGILPGSGVDLQHFAPAPPATRDAGAGPVFLLVARLLWDKGVGEFVEAARLVKARLPNARFQLLGFLDVENRTAVPRSAVDQWGREGIIEYLGHADDVRPFLAAAGCVVLPSYREGTPRSLLEAAAMARPLIATDVSGCREVVDDGINGYLCRPRDAADLADKLLAFSQLPESVRHEMGAQSRFKAEREFSETIVVNAYLATIEEILATGS